MTVSDEMLTIGVVGGGQLGRMLAEAGGPLGVELIVLDPTPMAPASLGARDQIVAPFDDTDAIVSLASRVDILTYEIELADPQALERAQAETGVPVHPDPQTLRVIQDKLRQNELLDAADIPIPAYRAVETPADVHRACDSLGYPAMIKARKGGYDGRGNVPIEAPDEAQQCLDAIGNQPAIVEEFIEFERELSVIGARGINGARTSYTPGENIHEEEILRETVVPARSSEKVRSRAIETATRVLEILDGRGVFGIELFETKTGEILVNEIAPRPHNSGHWTIEGAVTSQFAQHIRAISGWPLGSTQLRSPVVSANILGDVSNPQPATVQGIETILAESIAHLHWYGKREVRPLRKMGHITLYDPESDQTEPLLQRAHELIDAVTFVTPE